MSEGKYTIGNYKNKFQELVGEYGILPGGLLLGWSFPYIINNNCSNFSSSFPDWYVSLPLGILFFGASVYYKFIKK